MKIKIHTKSAGENKKVGIRRKNKKFGGLLNKQGKIPFKNVMRGARALREGMKQPWVLENILNLPKGYGGGTMVGPSGKYISRYLTPGEAQQYGRALDPIMKQVPSKILHNIGRMHEMGHGMGRSSEFGAGRIAGYKRSLGGVTSPSNIRGLTEGVYQHLKHKLIPSSGRGLKLPRGTRKTLREGLRRGRRMGHGLGDAVNQGKNLARRYGPRAASAGGAAAKAGLGALTGAGTAAAQTALPGLAIGWGAGELARPHSKTLRDIQDAGASYYGEALRGDMKDYLPGGKKWREEVGRLFR